MSDDTVIANPDPWEIVTALRAELTGTWTLLWAYREALEAVRRSHMNAVNAEPAHTFICATESISKNRACVCGLTETLAALALTGPEALAKAQAEHAKLRGMAEKATGTMEYFTALMTQPMSVSRTPPREIGGIE